jgi:hypothetical protein
MFWQEVPSILFEKGSPLLSVFFCYLFYYFVRSINGVCFRSGFYYGINEQSLILLVIVSVFEFTFISCTKSPYFLQIPLYKCSYARFQVKLTTTFVKKVVVLYIYVEGLFNLLPAR